MAAASAQPATSPHDSAHAPLHLDAHMRGSAMLLSNVPDPTFAQEVLGPGVAVEPTEGFLYAPCDAEITVAFPTGHAIGMKTAEGVELLAHIGIDTVGLEGAHFTLKVTQGQHVRKGDVLVEFNLDAIREAGYSLATPLVITNASKGFSAELAQGAHDGAEVAPGIPLLQVTR